MLNKKSKSILNLYSITIISIILIISIPFIFTNQSDKFFKTLNINKLLHKPSISYFSKFVTEIDTRGGMGNDGEYFLKIQLSDSNKEKFIKNTMDNTAWSNDLNTANFSKKVANLKAQTTESLKIGYTSSDYEILGNLDSLLNTNFDNAIYFFEDRSELVNNDSSALSYNYTFSVLDIDTNILYLYTYDA